MPRASTGRTEQVLVRFTTTERAWLEERRRITSHQSAAELLRWLALRDVDPNEPAVAVMPAERKAIVAAVGQLGHDLSRIARLVAHVASGEHSSASTPDDLSAAFKDLRAVRLALVALVGRTRS